MKNTDSNSSIHLELIDDTTSKNGRVTFYADSRTPRSHSDRRKTIERRRSIRFTSDRRNSQDRRQQTMNWNNGYQFTSTLSLQP